MSFLEPTEIVRARSKRKKGRGGCKKGRVRSIAAIPAKSTPSHSLHTPFHRFLPYSALLPHFPDSPTDLSAPAGNRGPNNPGRTSPQCAIEHLWHFCSSCSTSAKSQQDRAAKLSGSILLHHLHSLPFYHLFISGII